MDMFAFLLRKQLMVTEHCFVEEKANIPHNFHGGKKHIQDHDFISILSSCAIDYAMILVY